MKYQTKGSEMFNKDQFEYITNWLTERYTDKDNLSYSYDFIWSVMVTEATEYLISIIKDVPMNQVNKVMEKALSAAIDENYSEDEDEIEMSVLRKDPITGDYRDVVRV